VTQVIERSRPRQSKRPKLLIDGGFAIFDGLHGLPHPTALLHEALNLARHAERQHHDIDAAEDSRGGVPNRRLFSSPGGAIQYASYASGELLHSVTDAVGTSVQPSGLQGTYSYYVRPGDYLGLHRDIEECDVAVITCLCDVGGAVDSGALQLYPERIAEPLSRIRSTPDKGLMSVHLRPGQTIILLGGYVPHATTAMGNGQKRIISVLCFRGIGCV
jgi:hypothetical protein